MSDSRLKELLGKRIIDLGKFMEGRFPDETLVEFGETATDRESQFFHVGQKWGLERLYRDYFGADELAQLKRSAKPVVHITEELYLQLLKGAKKSAPSDSELEEARQIGVYWSVAMLHLLPGEHGFCNVCQVETEVTPRNIAKGEA